MHGNQSHLGRCVTWLKRDGVIDLLTITNEEREELWEIITRLRKALKKVFGPDHFNYTALANVTHHLHVHVIPRYKDKRIFEKLEFVDKKFGQNPYPVDKKFKTQKKIFYKIRDTIKDAL